MSGWRTAQSTDEGDFWRLDYLVDDSGRELAQIENFGAEKSFYLWVVNSLDRDTMIRIGPQHDLPTAIAHAERLLVEGTQKYEGAATRARRKW